MHDSEAKPDSAMQGAGRQLPLLTLHLTERCNSRCVSCDYWRHGRNDLDADRVAQLLPELRELGTHTVLLSGGEPLVHPQWIEIAETLQAAGISLWLVTSGLSLSKHVESVARLFSCITVSLDGVDPAMYLAIRGVNAFAKVCEGIRALAARHDNVGVRVTLQRANYFALPQFVRLARDLRVKEISFLAADVRNGNAFGRDGGFRTDLALEREDLSRLSATLAELEGEFGEEFSSGFIAERPEKLRRMLVYFRALCGLEDFPPVRCNAPEFSAVLDVDGSVRPCFFIPSPVNMSAARGLADAVRSTSLAELRAAIASNRRPECVSCVCSLWRDHGELERPLTRRIAPARGSSAWSTPQ